MYFSSCNCCEESAGGDNFKIQRNYTKLYNSGVTPILEYSCAVSPCTKANEIDVIQNWAMHYFLGVHKYATNVGLSGDMEWIKHCYNKYLFVFRFWNRWLYMEEYRLTKQIFNWNYVNQRGWCQDIKHLLIQLDLEYALSEKLSIDIDRVKLS